MELYSIATGRVRKEVNLPLRLKDIVAYIFLVIFSNPMSFHEALQSKNSDK